MNRIYNILLIVFILSISAVEASASESFMVLDSTDVQTMLKNIEYIENNGGNITHRFPPNILIGDIPVDKINGLKGKMNIKDINTDIVDNSTLTDKKKKVVADVWNNVYKHLDKDKNYKPKGKPKQLLDDSKIINKTDKTVTINPYSSIGNIPPYGAGFYDTSAYMIGDIAVGIILPESNGAIDPNLESWTLNEESNVLSEIVRGLNWWSAQNPSSRLTFTYDIYYDVPTNYEPISRPWYDQNLWIQDSMKYIGFSKFGSNYFDNVYDYNNRLRESMGTDWAYTIFVVDSSNDLDGQFSGGMSGYAYLGGPFTVLTYDNDGYGIDNMDYVAAHETGHIFYATDEYNGYTEYSGYLDASDIESSGKIMHCALCWGVSSGTALQLGWRDSNVNNIFDIIDFKPYSQWGNIGNGDAPTITGRSYSTGTYPNNNPYGSGNDITINKIISVQYRVDNGDWQNAQPSDGIFDDSIEDFTFTTIPLSDGYHTVDVRSRDTAGIWESPYITKNIYISPISITVVSPNGGEIWQSGSTKTVKWSYTGNPGSTVNVDLLKNGAVVKTIASGISIGSNGNGTYSWKMDTSRTPGTDYKIRVTSTSNSAYTDMSDNNFAITGPIIVTSPNGGENWRRGTSHTITWSKAGSSGSYVKIELLRSGSAVKTITSSTSNDGSYSWSISSTQTVASDYQIRITSTSNSAYKDTSDNYFTIST